MSQWHREHPELAGTDRDPWMRNEGYRKIVAPPVDDREPEGERGGVDCTCPSCRASAALRDKDQQEG